MLMIAGFMTFTFTLLLHSTAGGGAAADDS